MKKNRKFIKYETVSDEMFLKIASKVDKKYKKALKVLAKSSD